MKNIFTDRVVSDISNAMLYISLIIVASRNNIEIVNTLSLYLFIGLGGWLLARSIFLALGKGKVTSESFFSKYKLFIKPMAYLILLSIMLIGRP